MKYPKKNLLFSFLLAINTIISFAQTQLGGTINSNVTLQKSNSPYLIETNLVIAPNGKVIVDPGVEIRFGTGATLEVRGDLIARGTSSDTIRFTSQSNSATKGSWGGITIVNPQGATADFDFCKFSYAASAITETCCWNGAVSVGHTFFYNNIYALSGYSGTVTEVDSCIFSYNTYAISHADKNISNSVFDHNDYGLASTERTSVSNSVFTHHSQAAIHARSGMVSNTTIENNNVGLKADGGMSVHKSSISHNITGVELSAPDGSLASIDSSMICSNTSYNVINTSGLDTDFYTNCWCTSDSTAIEDKILDGWDTDSTGFVRGLVSYEISDAACEVVLSRVDKNIPISVNWTLEKSPYILNHNFVVFPNVTLTIDPGVEVLFGEGAMLEVRGDLIARGTSSDTIRFTSQSNSATKGSWGGITIVNPQGATADFDFCKFSYAASAITETCCWNGAVSVGHTFFYNNIYALSGYSGTVTEVDSCIFSYNTYAISHADKNISNSVFDHNDYGLASTERTSVSNSVFTHHSQAAIHARSGMVSNTTIENNNVGLKADGGMSVHKSSISHNITGVELSAPDGSLASIDSSMICSNTSYNVINTSGLDTDFYTNCWCTSDSTAIEDKILDGWDTDSTGFVRGLVSYEISDAACEVVLSRVDKNIPISVNWTLEKSPYILNHNFVVFPNVTLTIDPGVEVLFGEGAMLEVRGDLIARGTSSDTIRFTSQSNSATKGNWGGITIVNPQGATADFDFCKFSYAASAITETCCWNGAVSVGHTFFYNNIYALSGYSGTVTEVDSCIFSYNTYAISHADKNISNSVFDHNDYGLASTERTSVSNSVFTHHSQAAIHARSGMVSNTTIENNNVGLKADGGMSVHKSSISHNITGVELSAPDGSLASIDSSMICSNTSYNVINKSNVSTELYSNCWCTSDSTVIEDKIFDGWDDSSRGLVDYTLYSDDCEVAVYNTIKAEGRVAYFNLVTGSESPGENQLSFYPNPAKNYISLRNADYAKELIILSMNGQQILKVSIDEHTDSIDISRISNGLYVLIFTGKYGNQVISKLYIYR